MRAKGSITVYLSLVLLLILSLLLTLIESARVGALEAEANRSALTAAESLFSEYNRTLLSEYDLFALDGGYGKEEFAIEDAQGRMEYFLSRTRSQTDSSLFERMDFLNLKTQEVQLTQYGFLTDDNGAAYRQMASAYVKENIPAQALTLFAQYATGADEEAGDEIDAKWEQTEQARQDLATGNGVSTERNEEISDADLEKAAQVTTEQKSILDTVKALRAKGVLALLIEDPTSLSDASIEGETLLTERSLNSGSMQNEAPASTDAILFRYYLHDKFTSFENGKENHALQYELEYLYGGKKSDTANLELVAGTLLVIREAVNLAYLYNDTQKREEARIIAIAIAGAFAVPALVGAFQAGILLAWAFLDSVKDLQTLFGGGKVPLVRLAGTQESGVEVSYDMYLQMLLATKSIQQLTMRSLNLIECNVRKAEDSKICLDHCMTQAAWSVTQTGRAIFPVRDGNYRYTSEGSFQYE